MKYCIQYWAENFSKIIGYKNDEIITQKQFISLIKSKPFINKKNPVYLQFLIAHSRSKEYDFFIYIDDRMFKTR